MLSHSRFVEYILIAIACALVLFFSSYRLFESPETWMDEGLIMQSAQGLLETGKASLPVAPGVFEPAWYITTGFPLTLPLAGVFSVFGVSLEAARLVMLVFLLAFYVVLFIYARQAVGGLAAWLGFFLLVFFAPIYGNGRNVLGEIPGLLFMLLALLPLIGGRELSRRKALWVGVGTGLAVATKPIFVLLIPALLLALLLRREIGLKKVFIFGVLGSILPLAFFVVTQFSHVSFANILALYVNPHDLPILDVVWSNGKRLVMELQPLYFLSALVLWIISYIVRRLRRETISVTEEVLLFFSVLILVAYMRTAGYYRYFFPGQVLALLYLPHTLWYLFGQRSVLFSRVVIVSLCALILFQAYETATRSWVAVHYHATRTESLKKYFAALPPEQEIFIYQAPEVAPFAAGRPMYQYVEITPSIRTGEQYRHMVQTGAAPFVITTNNMFSLGTSTIFMHYVFDKNFDDYVVLVSKDH